MVYTNIVDGLLDDQLPQRLKKIFETEAEAAEPKIYQGKETFVHSNRKHESLIISHLRRARLVPDLYGHRDHRGEEPP